MAHGKTSPSRSLPSFAQTFNHPLLRPTHSSSHHAEPDIGPRPDLALPPIQRQHIHSPSPAVSESDPVIVKQEPSNDPVPIEASPARSKRKAAAHPHPHSEATPPDNVSDSPTGSRPSKKRRVTISGTPQPRQPFDSSLSLATPSSSHDLSPLSPVVVGFSIPSSDPRIMDQVRKTLSLKQQQKAIIEQRKAGNNNGNPPVPPPPPPPTLVTPATPTQDAPEDRPGNPRSRRPSISSQSPARSPVSTQQHTPWQIDPSTSFSQRRLLQQQQSQAPPCSSSSIAKKSLTLTIKPPAQFSPSMQPVIQSAPPIPGQSFRGGRLSRTMAGGHGGERNGGEGVRVPVLPNLSGHGGASSLGAGAHVQSKRQQHVQQQGQQQHGPPPLGRVSSSPLVAPRTPSVRLSNVHSPTFLLGSYSQQQNNGHPRAPPTPVTTQQPTPISAPLHPSGSLHPPSHPDHNLGSPEHNKASFLSLFSNFYDSLADSKQLKAWLQDQLAKSNSLLTGFEQKSKSALNEFQVRSGEALAGFEGRAGEKVPILSGETGMGNRMEHLIESMMERKLVSWKDEMGELKDQVVGLRRRVMELEDELKAKGGRITPGGLLAGSSPRLAGGGLSPGSMGRPLSPSLWNEADCPQQSPPMSDQRPMNDRNSVGEQRSSRSKISTSPASLPSILINGSSGPEDSHPRGDSPSLAVPEPRAQRQLMERMPPIMGRSMMDRGSHTPASGNQQDSPGGGNGGRQEHGIMTPPSRPGSTRSSLSGSGQSRSPSLGPRQGHGHGHETVMRDVVMSSSRRSPPPHLRQSPSRADTGTLRRSTPRPMIVDG